MKTKYNIRGKCLLITLILFLNSFFDLYGQVGMNGSITVEEDNGSSVVMIPMYIEYEEAEGWDVSDVAIVGGSYDLQIDWYYDPTTEEHIDSYTTRTYFDMYVYFSESPYDVSYPFRLLITTSNGELSTNNFYLPANTMTGDKNYTGTISAPSIINYGTNFTITEQEAAFIKATGYQWQRRPKNSSNWEDVANSNSRTLTILATDDYVYRRKLITHAGNTIYSNEVNAFLYDIGGGTLSSNQTIVAGRVPSALTLSGVTGGGGGTLSYQWQQSFNNSNWSDIPGATGQTYSPGELDATTYYRVQIRSSAGSSGFSPTCTISVIPELNPGYVSSDQTIKAGYAASALTLNGVSEGSGPGSYTYRWQHRSEGSSVWSDIPGVSQYTTTYSPGYMMHTTYYRVLVTSGSGSVAQTRESGACKITVIPMEAYLTDFWWSSSYPFAYNCGNIVGVYETDWEVNDADLIASKLEELFRTNYNMSVPVSGMVSESNSRQGTLIISMPVNRTPSVQDYYFRIGNGDIHIQQQPITGGLWTYHVSGGGNLANGAATITLDNSQPGGVTYQLLGNGDAVIQSQTGSGSSLSFTNITTPGRYKVRAIYGNNTLQMDGEVEVYSVLSGGQVVSGGSIVSGTVAPTLTVSGVSGGIGVWSYQWQQSDDNATWSHIAGQTGTDYSPGPLTATKYYRVQVTSGSQTKESGSATVTVIPVLNAGAVSGSQSIVSGSSASTLSVTGMTGGTEPYSYQWQHSGDNATWTDMAGQTGTSLNPGVLTSTTYYRVRITSGTGSVQQTKTTSAGTVTVVPQVAAGNVSSPQSIITGTAPSGLTLSGVTSGTPPYAYQWQQSTDNGASWTDISGASNTTYTPGVLTQTTRYRVRVTCGSGSTYQEKYSGEATITVYGDINPGTLSGNQTLYDDEPLAVLTSTPATGGNGSISYQWQMKPGDASVWSDIAGATGENYQPQAVIGTTSYRRNAICLGVTRTSNEVSVTISYRYPPVAFTTTENYVSQRILQAPVTDVSGITTLNSMSTVTYYDGLGRPKQKVEVGATPDRKDVVTPIVYDPVGRDDAKQYLPYASATGTGSYQSSALTAQQAFYTTLFGAADAQYGYAEKVYEASPLNRVLAQYNVGDVYRANDKKTSYGYRTNETGEVLNLSVNADGSLTASGHYNPKTLYKNSVTNEDALQTITYTDFQGRKLLDRTVDNTTSTPVHVDTYYVYDDLNRLRWVVSPEGSKDLTPSGTYGTNDPLLTRFAYRYVYDGRGRVIEKRQPGSEPVYMVYDEGDRVTATRTANDSIAGCWTLTQYDAFGRPTTQWSVTSTDTRAQMQQNYANLYTTGTKTLLASYAYDSYPAGSMAFQPVDDIVTTYDIRTKGMKTYEKVAVLGTDTYVERTFYYDDKGRLVQTVDKNHLGYGGRVSTQYDFTGNVLVLMESYRTGANDHHSVRTLHSYDHRGRLLTSSTIHDGRAPAEVSYAYNALGQQTGKNYGSGVYKQTSTTQYNIQGWLTRQSSPKFTMTLNYFTPTGIAPSYTGNIAQWNWGHGTAADQSYTFSYDALGRLNSGIHSGNAFNESGLTYDLNGNILTLQRTGNSADDFTYAYDGNRLVSLSGSTTGSYEYDANGNLQKDTRKSLEFRYNYLNLVQDVRDLSGNVKANYLYAADGTKLGVSDATGQNGFDYLGSLTLVKNNGSLSLECNFGEGLIRGGEIVYFEKDHLGSVRSVVNQNGETVEQNDFYPFGLKHANSNLLIGGNRYLFNGKENQITGNIGLLDYGARMYDSELGRWFVQDPLADQRFNVSLYNYCQNNPVMRIDPNGMLDDEYFDKYGRYLGQDNATTDKIRIMDEKTWAENKQPDNTIDHEVGSANSTVFSEAVMTDNAALQVYDHYNVSITGVTLKVNNDSKGNMTTVANGVKETNALADVYIDVNINRNRESGLYDNASNVINSFEHELKHVSDAQTNFNRYSSMDKSEREIRAIRHQTSTPTWNKTTLGYKQTIFNYYQTFK